MVSEHSALQFSLTLLQLSGGAGGGIVGSGQSDGNVLQNVGAGGGGTSIGGGGGGAGTGQTIIAPLK